MCSCKDKTPVPLLFASPSAPDSRRWCQLDLPVAQPVWKGSLAIVTRQAPTSPRRPVWLLPPRKTLCLLTIPNLFSGLLKYHSAEGLSSPATVVTVFCHLLSVSPHPHLLREEAGHEATGSGARHSGLAFWLCNSLPVRLWKSYFACLCLRFLICKTVATS